MMRSAAVAVLLAGLVLPLTRAGADPIPPRFESDRDDRAAIEALLATYTKAVSTKDEALFVTLLLNTGISFSDADSAVRAGNTPGGAERFQAFHKDVFEGPPFTQRFQDIHIAQDGPLAAVSLVFVNKDSHGSSWGWKTLQLLKVGGRWRIASEFYTGHPGPAGDGAGR